MLSLRKLVCVLTMVVAGSAAQADTVKVGVIGPFSGPFASAFGTPFRQGIETFVSLNGDPAPNTKIEFVYRDLGLGDPARARSLAQELITGEKVQYLAGFVFTPNALAVAPIIESAKIPTVIFNASTSVVVSKSNYFVRTSNTLPQVTVPVAKRALERGISRVITIVSDYGPGIDAETAFKRTFEEGKGEIVESIRMPLSTTDFGPFLQRIRLAKPDALFTFLPFGPPTFGFVKAYNDNGLRQSGVRFLGTAETQETDLQALGDPAIGLETGYFYSGAHRSPENKAFVERLEKLFPGAIANPATVSAFDGTRALYTMIKATGGKADPAGAMAAIKGAKWESPRGPISIDPQTRDIIQNVYIRNVKRDESGKLINEEIQIYADQPDYGAAPAAK
ncbi:ABC transporter substrate-binding protein [Tardiphaga sp. OK245]|uniref:ABC transporter substrate-binding protein n=1 Tax=Tardiphaga sp. OK245 TaxID=1855306 RepID=UPI0008A7FDB7|nr:ABC transporter substrate-binding protein [Tardiphaga sp. OK245]SEI21050.1 branched-chain amino acid transport system substrate-binding protein [Tardiphaga sp. OK245]